MPPATDYLRATGVVVAVAIRYRYLVHRDFIPVRHQNLAVALFKLVHPGWTRLALLVGIIAFLVLPNNGPGRDGRNL